VTLSVVTAGGGGGGGGTTASMGTGAHTRSIFCRRGNEAGERVEERTGMASISI
jgi:hypothetical protein